MLPNFGFLSRVFHLHKFWISSQLFRLSGFRNLCQFLSFFSCYPSFPFVPIGARVESLGEAGESTESRGLAFCLLLFFDFFLKGECTSVEMARGRQGSMLIAHKKHTASSKHAEHASTYHSFSTFLFCFPLCIRLALRA